MLWILGFFFSSVGRILFFGTSQDKASTLKSAEFFIDGLGFLHSGSCSDIIVNHASKIQLPWTKTDSQKEYEKLRYASGNPDNIDNEIFYFKYRFKCKTLQ